MIPVLVINKGTLTNKMTPVSSTTSYFLSHFQKLILKIKNIFHLWFKAKNFTLDYSSNQCGNMSYKIYLLFESQP